MRRTGKHGAGSTRPAVEQGPSQVSVEEVSALIRLMDENHLVEIEIESHGSKIRLVKDRPQAEVTRVGPHTIPSGASAASTSPVAHPVQATEQALDQGKAIISPMVGTFYRAPSPDAPPFVEVGSVVEKGDTLCLIEAMKMMNEIEAEFRGKVARVVAENGQTVEYGESLFLIDPL
jgi:acetyl-CoA carboxylase biotin carboxyl carrier protein